MPGTLINQQYNQLVNIPLGALQSVVLPDLLIMVDNESPGKTSLTAKDGHRTEKIAVPFDIAYDAQLAILGYSYTSGMAAKASLKRLVPLRHPLYTNYYCSGVNNEYGYQFTGKYPSPTGTGNPGVQQFGAKYIYSIFDATFEPNKIYYAPDSAQLPEYNRYISYEYDGRAEFIERPFGQMVFTEGPGAGHPFQGRSISIETKADFQVTWWQVPEDWVSINGVGLPGFPTKIFNCIGTLNNTAIWNFPKGTLLMLKPKVLRYPCPLMLMNPGTLSPQTFYLDIQLNFVWFDPPGAPTTKGHNNKPWFPGEVGTQMKYYLATARKKDRSASTVQTYPYSEFKDMFTNVNA